MRERQRRGGKINKERERGRGGRDGVEGRVRGWEGGRLCCGNIII